MSEPQPPTRAATFDVRTIEAIQAALKPILAATPEARSLVVIVDWAGGLNDANIHKAIWLGREGPVIDLPTVFGTLRNTLKMLEVMQLRMAELTIEMGDKSAKKAAELLELEKKIHALKQSPGDNGATGDAGLTSG